MCDVIQVGEQYGRLLRFFFEIKNFILIIFNNFYVLEQFVSYFARMLKKNWQFH